MTGDSSGSGMAGSIELKERKLRHVEHQLKRGGVRKAAFKARGLEGRRGRTWEKSGWGWGRRTAREVLKEPLEQGCAIKNKNKNEKTESPPKTQNSKGGAEF